MRTTVVGLKLADEFLPTVPRDDKYTVRIEGLGKMRASSVLIFSAVEQSLAERNFYSGADLSLLLDGMRETVPDAVGSFTENYRVELVAKLQRRLKEFPAERDQEALRVIIDTLENSRTAGASTEPTAQ
jgi:hypothetical protein